VSDATVVHGQNCICHLCQPSGVSVVRQVAAAGPRCSDGTHVLANRPTRPHTAFVLSGGASLGALQVGMLRAVYSSDVELILLPALTTRRYSRSTSIIRAA
jgi:hypothetical protein